MMVELTSGSLGPYKLLAPVGKGGMGTVWAARKDGRMYALKALSQPDERLEQMFAQEADLAARIEHPNVVRTYGREVHSGVSCLVMEFVRGETMVRLFRAVRGPLPYGAAVHAIAKVCRGLQAAHDLGCVHRDVSPQNVLLTEEGDVKLIDFGIAKMESESDSDLTRKGEIKGKIAYLAPEQICGGSADHRSDLWAVGILAYQALLARNPFRGKTDAETMRNLCEESAVTPPSEFCLGFPKPLEAFLIRALERSPERRWQSAAEMADALEAAYPADEDGLRSLVKTHLSEQIRKNDGLISAATEAEGQQAPKEAPRGRVTAAGTGAALACLLALGAAGAWAGSVESSSPRGTPAAAKAADDGGGEKVVRIHRVRMPAYAPRPRAASPDPDQGQDRGTRKGRRGRRGGGPLDRPFALPLR